jgi:hypothetical protein
VPDLLHGHVDGTVTVVDVKAASRLNGPKVSAQFAWAKDLCEQRGFQVRSVVEHGPRASGECAVPRWLSPPSIDHPGTGAVGVETIAISLCAFVNVERRLADVAQRGVVARSCCTCCGNHGWLRTYPVR